MFGLKNEVRSLHEVCNTFFSVTLPLVHFETTCSSLNALLARVMTFSRNRRCKWNSYDLIIVRKHLQRTVDHFRKREARKKSDPAETTTTTPIMC